MTTDEVSYEDRVLADVAGMSDRALKLNWTFAKELAPDDEVWYDALDSEMKKRGLT